MYTLIILNTQSFNKSNSMCDGLFGGYNEVLLQKAEKKLAQAIVVYKRTTPGTSEAVDAQRIVNLRKVYRDALKAFIVRTKVGVAAGIAWEEFEKNEDLKHESDIAWASELYSIKTAKHAVSLFNLSKRAFMDGRDYDPEVDGEPDDNMGSEYEYTDDLEEDLEGDQVDRQESIDKKIPRFIHFAVTTIHGNDNSTYPSDFGSGLPVDFVLKENPDEDVDEEVSLDDYTTDDLIHLYVSTPT